MSTGWFTREERVSTVDRIKVNTISSVLVRVLLQYPVLLWSISCQTDSEPLLHQKQKTTLATKKKRKRKRKIHLTMTRTLEKVRIT